MSEKCLLSDFIFKAAILTNTESSDCQSVGLLLIPFSDNLFVSSNASGLILIMLTQQLVKYNCGNDVTGPNSTYVWDLAKMESMCLTSVAGGLTV